VLPLALRHGDGKVDIGADEHNATLNMEVPGIDDKDIDVRMENNRKGATNSINPPVRGEGLPRVDFRHG